VSTLNLLFDALREQPSLHAPSTAFYRLCKATARAAIEPLFSAAERVTRKFGPFGELSLPYTRMGNIDSLDLFGLDELIIFAFYHANRSRYRRVLDIGANLGLHSIVMDRCGFSVNAFEPDPWHYGMLVENLASNRASRVEPIAAAVSTRDGNAEFVRVLGNTTGSHLAGSKDSYGERETFTVPTCAVQPLFGAADFAKIDAEGHEKELLLTTTRATMSQLDIMVEIGNAANAKAVFEHFQAIGIGMFPQKIAGAKRRNIPDANVASRRHLFITPKPTMPW
jgi:FkbM family methyltransferase